MSVRTSPRPGGWESLTAEQRRERTRPAREARRRATLDRWVEGVIAKAPELTPAQRDVIAAALAVSGGQK